MPRPAIASLVSLCLTLLVPLSPLFGQDLPGDRMIAEYFERETAKLRDHCLSDIDSLEQWNAKRQQYRDELLEMLGLSSLPERTELAAEVTGTTEHDEFVVERVQFQSRPGLYVTGNLYRPKKAEKPLPAILYVCGHGRVTKDGVSYGNKVHYQHHGAWFARNGYVCLTIDTLQLGEIEGVHHGTYSHNRWWWLNRGYTPAGVEAWNCVRALDYLQTRDEVDGERLGVTGRSGGGAYSWWIAAIDDRIQAAVPVAGITDLENHVVDGCVEGHCDCMFMVNTFRWDYAKVAALVAPRPLLISNTDRDGIFPLEGVTRTHALVRKIYRLHDAEEKLALHITSGPHKDTQELRVHAFRWFNQHLRNNDELIEKTAVKYFEPEQLRVFTPGKEPTDERNTKIDESFVAAAPSPAPIENPEQWRQRQAEIRNWLDTRVFAGWPDKQDPLNMQLAFTQRHRGLRLDAWDFTSQEPFRLRLYVLRGDQVERPELTVLNVHDADSHAEWLRMMQPAFADQLDGEPEIDSNETASEEAAKQFEATRRMLQAQPWAMAYVAPRGIGRSRWDPSDRKQTQHRRRFYLLGQSLNGMQAYDVRRAIQATRWLPSVSDQSLWLQSNGVMGVVTAYASLYEPPLGRIDLHDLPSDHRDGPFLLNVSRQVTMPEVISMVADHSRLVLYGKDESAAGHAAALKEKLGWEPRQFQFRSTAQVSGGSDN